MSENIVHTAVVEDCINLMLASGGLGDRMREAAQRHLDFARLGSVTRGGDAYTCDLLSAFRSHRERGEGDTPFVPGLAFVMGWLCHRAADRQMKPIWRSMPGETGSPTECSVYHEATIFRAYYAREEGSLYPLAVRPDATEGHPAGREVRTGEMMELIRALARRALIELHTLIPDPDDVEGWLRRLYRRTQELDRNVIERYARAIAEPEPDKVRRYVEETNFFDPGEEIIVLARELRRGGKAEARDLETVLSRPPASHYGRAVYRGCGYLRAACEFLDGELDREGLERRLEIGKPGRHGGSV